MIVKVYRYEDKNGFGPFWNIYQKEYNWKDDNFREGCLSIEDLKTWFNRSAPNIDLSKYKIKEYLVDLPPKEKPYINYGDRIYCVYSVDGTVYFNLSWIKEK